MKTELDYLGSADGGLTAVMAHGILNALQGAVVGPRFCTAGAEPELYCPMIRRSLQVAIDSSEDLEAPFGVLLRASLLPASDAAVDLEARLEANPEQAAEVLLFIQSAARRAEDVLRGLVQGLPDDAVVYLDELAARSAPPLPS
jgi:hypothetical protein